MKSEDMFAGYGVIKRDGTLAKFDPRAIALAISKAYVDVFGGDGSRMHDVVHRTTDAVVVALMRDKLRTNFGIEEIQDQVELALMRAGEHDLARGYVLFREKKAEMRRQAQDNARPKKLVEGVALDIDSLTADIARMCPDLKADFRSIAERAELEIFDGATRADVTKAVSLAVRTLIEQDPVYDRIAARLSLGALYEEVIGAAVALEDRQATMQEAFPGLIRKGVEAGLLDPRMREFDLPFLASRLVGERDYKFDSLGLTTLYDRYFLHINKRRFEVPQTFLMRVAMGLALEEIDREKRAVQFYEVLSSFDFMNSTPTLFNAGTARPQLASCFLTTVSDDLESIYDAIKENALLQKYAGGLGNDWTRVRSLGAHIKGTNGESQGVIPFLKVVNDTAVAVNQGGKRKGAVCAYLETWHLDIEAFLDLRKNTGDDRRRTHDMNTANWIPDLFMLRVHKGGDWTLFSPSDVPDLHDLYGKKFEAAYVKYEEEAKAGRIKSKTIPAVDLWRKMLAMLFETGHPWITFKDPCNIRSPQQHVGVVHSSNLCTEITLNTGPDEIAVCNIGSVNLVNHIVDGKLDGEKLRTTVRTAMRMLDNVIGINHYSVKKARDSNLRHRPVGIGMMGFQGALFEMGISYASDAAVVFADRSAEALCYYAYEASSDLAAERGSYSSFKGSLWSRGILPQDTIAMLREQRGGYLEVDESSSMDWDALRKKILAQGMRNSNCVAIAPTATIGNIVGVDASIEPTFTNLSVKSNLSGEFTVVNEKLVKALKDRGLWDLPMLADLKHYDGSVQPIDRVPQELKDLFLTAFEVDPRWLIECASRRQKWIDQAQSLNIYMAGTSGKKLDEAYKLAWVRGLKTTYYLRTSGATAAEKATGRAGSLNAVSAASSANNIQPETVGPACTLRPGDQGFETCEACQ